jgi:hypothetical protein
MSIRVYERTNYHPELYVPAATKADATIVLPDDVVDKELADNIYPSPRFMRYFINSSGELHTL